MSTSIYKEDMADRSIDEVVDATYVINLERNIGRLQEFDAIMAACEWNYERQEGVDGKQLMSRTPVEGNIDMDRQRERLHRYINSSNWLSPAEIGCALSHITLWEEIANSPDKRRIAVFEDDARTHAVGPTIPNLLAEFYDYLDANNIEEPDMLYLGKALDDCLSYEQVWGRIYRSYHPLCLHAYIISKRGAQKLLALAPYSLAIDMVTLKAAQRRQIAVMVFHPSLFFQDVLDTDSDLRKRINAVNHTTECMISQQHVTGETWEYLIVVAIAVIAALILFVLFLW